MPVWTNMSQLKLIGFALLMAAMAFGALAFYGPEVSRDLEIRLAHTKWHTIFAPPRAPAGGTFFWCRCAAPRSIRPTATNPRAAPSS